CKHHIDRTNRGRRISLWRATHVTGVSKPMNRLPLDGPRANVLIGLLLVGTGIVAIAALASPSAAQPLVVPAGICPGGPPVLQLANPNPGDNLSQGDYVVAGVAYDPSASQGSGIANVELFLGPRETGGIPLGDAQVGLNPAQPRVFQTTVNFPSSA